MARYRVCPYCKRRLPSSVKSSNAYHHTIRHYLLTPREVERNTLSQMEMLIRQGKHDEPLSAIYAAYRSAYEHKWGKSALGSQHITPENSAPENALQPQGQTDSRASGEQSIETQPVAPPVPSAVIPATDIFPVLAKPPRITPPPANVPIFSWDAFLSEQAIVLMAYLGAFLLLIATLTLEIGAWQVLSSMLKLVVVFSTYVIIGVLSWMFARLSHWQTVSTVYTAIFALMTPLVALAVYLFELAPRHVVASGAFCMSAAYAAAIYLVLAYRTRFMLYGYLGWASFIAAVVAAINWFAVPSSWWASILALTCLGMLLVYRYSSDTRWLKHSAQREPLVLISAITFLYTCVRTYSLATLFRGITASQLSNWLSLGIGLTAMFASVHCILLIVETHPAKGAHVTVVRGVRNVLLRERGSNVWLLWFIYLSVVISRLSLAIFGYVLEFTSADSFSVNASSLHTVRLDRYIALSALVAVALCEGAIALIARVTAPTFKIISRRMPLVALTVALLSIIVGNLIQMDGVVADAGPLIVSLTATAVLGVLTSLAYPDPSWLGVTIWCGISDATTIASTFPSTKDGATYIHIASLLVPFPVCYPVAALILWTFALLLTGRIAPQHDAVTVPRRERLLLSVSNLNRSLQSWLDGPPIVGNIAYGIWLHLMALGLILFSVTQLTSYSDLLQTIILGVYAVWAGLTAAYYKRPWSIGLLEVCFGLLALHPYTGERTGFAGVIVAVVCVVSWRIVHEIFGWQWSAYPAVLALAAVLVSAWHANQRYVNLHSASFLGLSAAALILLAGAIASLYVGLVERSLFVGSISAALYLSVIWFTPQHHLISGVLVVGSLGFAAVGAKLKFREWSGLWLTITVMGATLLCFQLNDLGMQARYWQAPTLACVALLFLCAALITRMQSLTVPAMLYALATLWILPPWNALVLTLGTVVLCCGVAYVSVFWRVDFRWIAWLYGLGIGASLIAFKYLPIAKSPMQVDLIEVYLLSCAGVATLSGVVERHRGRLADVRWVGISSALSTWLMILLIAFSAPGPKTLLPVALGCFVIFGVLRLAFKGSTFQKVVGVNSFGGFYLAGSIAVAYGAWTSDTNLQFAALALITIAIAVYATSIMVEDRVYIFALALGLGGYIFMGRDLQWARWVFLLGALAIAWIYWAAELTWRVRPLFGEPPTFSFGDLGRANSTIRAAGRWLKLSGDISLSHRASAGLILIAVLLISVVSPMNFTRLSPQTQVCALALLCLTLMVALYGHLKNIPILWYAASIVASLAIMWEARWLGTTNLLGLVLAPSACLLVIGTLLPTDTRVQMPTVFARLASALGSLLLFSATLILSLTANAHSTEWTYIVISVIEALVIVCVGVGTRVRTLVLLGSSFVIVAAVQSVIVALDLNVPVSVYVAVFAVALLSCASWLSIRSATR